MCCTFLVPSSNFFFASSESWFQIIAPQKVKLLFRTSLFGLGKKPVYWMLSKKRRFAKQECRSRTVQKLQLLSDLAWDQAPYWRGREGGRGKKRGETAKNRRAVLFPLSRLPFDSLSLADFFRLFCPVLSLVPGSLRSESGDNKNQLCGVSITCNWGPLLL